MQAKMAAYEHNNDENYILKIKYIDSIGNNDNSKHHGSAADYDYSDNSANNHKNKNRAYKNKDENIRQETSSSTIDMSVNDSFIQQSHNHNDYLQPINCREDFGDCCSNLQQSDFDNDYHRAIVDNNEDHFSTCHQIYGNNTNQNSKKQVMPKVKLCKSK